MLMIYRWLNFYFFSLSLPCFRNAKDLKVIGFPVGINDPKFPRNKLIFNLCIVCIPTAKTLEYESVVEKLAHYLINLEIENAFLYNPETKAKLPYYMQQIKDQLNATKSCILPVSKCWTNCNRTIRSCLLILLWHQITFSMTHHET